MHAHVALVLGTLAIGCPRLTIVLVIRAPRGDVWTALNDPDVLKACIPGCESLEGSPEEGFAATEVQKEQPPHTASPNLPPRTCRVPFATSITRFL